MNKISKTTVKALLHSLFSIYIMMTATVHAGNSALKIFVVTLDESAGVILSESQSAAAESGVATSPEAKFGVSLQEEFLSSDYRYEILEAESKDNVLNYLEMLELTPLNIIESEFINSPELGGGPMALDTPREGHKIYVIERAVPEISSLPIEKQKEISQGSQSVVAQIGNSLEWDKSFLTQEGTFCVYRAEDEKHIREHATIAGFPADKVSAVEHVVHNFSF